MGYQSTEAFFEAKYRASGDPWNFAGDQYELGRYDATIRSLGGQRFRRALEPACSVGVLTERLAHVCDSVEAFDLSATAIEQARTRCEHYTNVKLDRANLRDYPLDGFFDLILLSEVAYYFEFGELLEISQRLLAHLSSGGRLVAVHWLEYSPDHVLSGDEVHAWLGNLPGLTPVLAERHAGFRIEHWVRQ